MSMVWRESGVTQTLSRLGDLECLSDLDDHVFEPLAEAFHAESLVIFRQQMDGPVHALRPVAALNQGKDVMSHYMQKISSLDPSMPYWRSVAFNAQSVWSYSDALQAAKSTDPRRFNQFLNERANVRHMLMMSFNIGDKGNDSLLCALHRAPGQNDFNDDERETAENVAPVMRQIYRGLAAAERETYASALAHCVLARGGNETQVLVNADGSIVCGDTRAKDLLSKYPASDQAKLRQSLKQLQHDVMSQEHARIDANTLGQFAGTVINAVPVDKSAKQFVLTVSPDEDTQSHAFSILTPRQLEVAELVAKGCRNWQVAELLGISENTVVNHLAAIYDSLAIGGRMELALLWKSQRQTH